MNMMMTSLLQKKNSKKGGVMTVVEMKVKFRIENKNKHKEKEKRST